MMRQGRETLGQAAGLARGRRAGKDRVTRRAGQSGGGYATSTTGSGGDRGPDVGDLRRRR